MTAVLLFVIAAILSSALTVVQTFLVWGFLRRPRRRLAEAPPRLESPKPPLAPRASTPQVSILKPLCGLEDELEENLASFACLDGVSYEVVLSVASSTDPAIEVAKRVMARFPASPFVLITGGVTPGLVANPKVERLIAASRVARGDIFFISDSNIRVLPDDIAQTIKAFDDPSVGCVSNPFTAEGASSFGAAIESLYLLSFVLPGVIFARAGGAVCVVGKSMAITRRVWDRIGGFEAFRDILAEDQAIGLAVKADGRRWELSTRVVRNVIVKRTLGQALDRQLRWGKIRFAFSKTLYTAEFLLNPFPLALTACFLSLLLTPQWLAYTAALAVGSACLRVTQVMAAGRATGAGLPFAHAVLAPVQDLLQFATQFIPFFSREVNWREHRARLGRGCVMLRTRQQRQRESQPAEAGLKWGRQL
ncbi:MAG TPA: glycosyltransferase [Blastocatellia bacterium]|nr:glycosyltransferase [Blastocatellia bacterium]